MSTCDVAPYLEGFTCPPGQMCCSARFEANPDASGIGIVVAFAVNGFINMSLATFLWYLKAFRRTPEKHNKYFEAYVQSLCDLLAQASLFPGITLLVACLSQWNSITHYHLWVSVVLADLATSGRVVVLLNLFFSEQRVTKIQASLAALFQSLFLACLGILIWRLSGNEWANVPGRCFAFRQGGQNNLQERDFVRFWVIVQLVAWFWWHLVWIFFTQLAARQFPDVRWLQIHNVPPRIRFWFGAVFYVGLDWFLWIWQLYLIAQGMTGNRDRIIGSEWGMGFGQVASLVALMTVFYAIFLSYQDYLLKAKGRRMNGEEQASRHAGGGRGSSHELYALNPSHSYSTDLEKINEDGDSGYQEGMPPPVTSPPVRQTRKATTNRRDKEMEMAFVAL
ncbi:SubName: Full=Uncharacterized protein {ECO:0000313/EMBL:CCA72252.1} [Serendipita indica DSM 11827]|uniref:Uncharacterized protein n=1 Tax=Serendipita indica (strain DSM 11827) TaxID=1109443 RepID=G4TLQ9_SERID|nr:SubName: Full=Uncharacterized protein {ECO:0000313/EMBL:CCA72252.1} [Serendipita indica DSM 11827]CCA72252.1 hypothetical protein PIIN_06186 [Serendipita indica DSM 11827]